MFPENDIIVSAAIFSIAALFVACWWLVFRRRAGSVAAVGEDEKQQEIFRAGRSAEAELLGCCKDGRTIIAGDVFVDIHVNGSWAVPAKSGKSKTYEEKQEPLLEGYQREDSTSYRERIHYIALLAGEKEPDKSEETAEETALPAIVLMHGYGLGAGALAKALEELSAEFPGRSVYAPDWLGCGLSSRPAWLRDLLQKSCKGSLDGRRPEQISESAAFVDFVEDLFLQALEQWRAQVIGDRRKIVLIGHSLAGYLSACYAERTHLAKNLASLVLASPVGIGSWRPEHAECEMEKASRLSDLEQRFGTDCSELKHNVTPYSFIPTDVPWDELSLSMRVAATIAKHFIVKMWEKRFSIHDTVKPFPSFMCQPIVGWIFGSRFKDNGQWKHPHEGFSRQNVAVYLHEIFRLPASGDYALPVMMEPGPYARRPLEMRIPKFASTVPIAFIYGDIDWMDRDGTNRLMQKFPNVKCHACEKSGHTLYMDNPSEFAKCVRKALEQVEMDAQSASINTKQRDLEAARIGDTSAAA